MNTQQAVKMLLQAQNMNNNNVAYTTEVYIAALLTTANILSERLRP